PPVTADAALSSAPPLRPGHWRTNFLLPAWTQGAYGAEVTQATRSSSARRGAAGRGSTPGPAACDLHRPWQAVTVLGRRRISPPHCRDGRAPAPTSRRVLTERTASMLSRRSLLAASGASAVGLGAAACGADPDSFAQGPIDFDTDGELEGSIRLLTPDFVGDARPDFDAMIEACHEQNPGVDVIVDQTDWDKLNEKLSTSIAGGLVPDVIMSGVGWTPPFAHKNIFGQIP